MLKRKYMHKPKLEYHLSKLMITLLCSVGLFLASSRPAQCDIYRFVTVDGIETFTDAPLDKSARMVIRDSSKKQPKSKKSAKTQKTHEVSLDEVVEKTVRASQGTRESTAGAAIEPRLPPVGGAITSGVGMRIDPIDGKLRQHNGIDIAIPEGTPVRPAAAGIVVYCGLRSGYGNTVLVEHDNGMVSLYGHNSRLAVIQGQLVDAETVIAYSGNTGRSTGPHLHFEAWQAGVNVTPAFMPGNGTVLPSIKMAAHRTQSRFRKEILADGSVLFTNIPSSIP